MIQRLHISKMYTPEGAIFGCFIERQEWMRFRLGREICMQRDELETSLVLLGAVIGVNTAGDDALDEHLLGHL